MKNDEVKVGGRYVARVSGQLVVVLVLEKPEQGVRRRRDYFSGEMKERKAVQRFRCRNERTGRELYLTAAKLRHEAPSA